MTEIRRGFLCLSVSAFAAPFQPPIEILGRYKPLGFWHIFENTTPPLSFQRISSVGPDSLSRELVSEQEWDGDKEGGGDSGYRSVLYEQLSN